MFSYAYSSPLFIPYFNFNITKWEPNPILTVQQILHARLYSRVTIMKKVGKFSWGWHSRAHLLFLVGIYQQARVVMMIYLLILLVENMGSGEVGTLNSIVTYPLDISTWCLTGVQTTSPFISICHTNRVKPHHSITQYLQMFLFTKVCL